MIESRAGGRDQRHVRHVVDGELAEALALGDALGEQAGGDAMRRRHAVADEQDDVLGLARPGVVDVPGHAAAARAVADFDRVAPGLRQRDVAQHQRRLVLAVLALDERRRPAERGGIVLAVHRHLQLRRIDPVREFDLEVELRAGKDLGAVDRIDGLGKQRAIADARTMRDAAAKCLIMMEAPRQKLSARGHCGRHLSHDRARARICQPTRP